MVSKTVDMGLISYILNSPAAKAEYSKFEPVKELKRRNLKLKISPTISSSDVKTYRRIVPKVARKAPREVPAPPPARPAQVVVDTVTAFYEDYEAHPASHNAVIKTLSPEMRERLHARRIRGGAVAVGLAARLKIGVYFFTWYALNVVYNSEFLRTVYIYD
jgi:hypothetical protein